MERENAVTSYGVPFPSERSWTSVRCAAGHTLWGYGLPSVFGLNGPCPLCGHPTAEIVPHAGADDEVVAGG